MSLVGKYFFSKVNNHIHVYLFPVFFSRSEVTRGDIMGNDIANPPQTRLLKNPVSPKGTKNQRALTSLRADDFCVLMGFHL